MKIGPWTLTIARDGASNLEQSDRAWLVRRAAEKGLTPERYLQRLVLWERHKHERTWGRT